MFCILGLGLPYWAFLYGITIRFQAFSFRSLTDPFFASMAQMLHVKNIPQEIILAADHLLGFQGDSMRTNIQLDFGDGTAVSYSNLSWTEEGIKHVYKAAGIVRVTALAENLLGYDAATLYLHVTCKSCQFSR